MILYDNEIKQINLLISRRQSAIFVRSRLLKLAVSKHVQGRDLSFSPPYMTKSCQFETPFCHNLSEVKMNEVKMKESLMGYIVNRSSDI